MNKLIAAGLFGRGLVKLTSVEMLGRYNTCLKEMGVEPVDLPEISLDGMGFSHEVAAAKGDNYYLSHGSQVNHLAVIVTPEQRHKPVYFPINSFDRRLLDAYFSAFMRQITDITTNVAIGLDIDSAITLYESPLDLLSVDSVEVTTIADQLMEAARDQRQLVAAITADNNWADNEARKRIIESANEHNDLRFRQLDIPDWRFSPIQSFHTTAFGGVFVIRTTDGNDLIVLEDSSHKKLKVKGLDSFYIDDNGLVEQLENRGLIAVDLDWYQEHPEILEEKKDAVIASAICQQYPDIDYLGQSSASRKGLLRECSSTLPPWLAELEKLIIAISKNKPLDHKKLSRDLRLVLLRPAADLTADLEEVVGQLLSRFQPYSLLGTFTYDKNAFYEKYKQMTPAEQCWAIAEILKHYEPKMHRLSKESLTV